MTELAQKVLKLIQTAEGKSSFSKTEFKEYGISADDAETVLKELEESGHIYKDSTYISGTPSYKLS